MKLAASFVLCLLWSLADAAPTPLSRLEHLSIGGREYVRLSDWARSNGFRASWISKQEFRLSNSVARLGFTANSQRMTVNGVSVYLSAPVAQQGTAACIALVDVQTALQPLLWPRRTGPRGNLICLDPGHGGKDTGNREGSRFEKDYTLALARELSSQLRQAGYKVFLTRSRDTFVDLDERIDSAARGGANLFVSLHFNAASSEVCGSEVYCLTPARTASTNARGEGAGTGTLAGNLQNEGNVQLAYQIQRALTGQLGLADRGVRRARWAVLRKAQIPAVLVEGGFMSNPAEMKKISSAAWRRQLAQALLEGIKNYQIVTTARK